MTLALLPPKRALTAPVKAVETAAAPTPPKPPKPKAVKPKKVKVPEAVPVEAPVATKKAAKPVLVAKVEKTVKTVKPVKATKAAVENVVPKIKAIKSRHFSEEQVEALVIVAAMREISLAQTPKKLELRDVDERSQVLFNAKLGIPCRKCYTQGSEVEKIIAFFKKVPAEFVPFKWSKALFGTPAAA